MKAKIQKNMMLPLLCAVLAAWLVVGGMAVFILAKLTPQSVMTLLVGVSGVLLSALIPVLHRAAWVYSNIRKHHTAEYFYNLGNGVELQIAIAGYEKKVQTAVAAWLKRYVLQASFGALAVAFFVLLVAGIGVVNSILAVFVIIISVYMATYIGLFVMLYAVRRLCYDKFGNIKNN